MQTGRHAAEATEFELRFSLTQGSFTIAPDLTAAARAIALFGPSGSGKTSILEAIAGLRTPQRGRIAVHRRVLFDTETRTSVPVRDRHIGYVPQDVLLFPHLNVRKNITYAEGRRLRQNSDGQGRQDVDVPELDDLLGLTPLMDRRVAGLSGGERQRVALAFASVLIANRLAHVD